VAAVAWLVASVIVILNLKLLFDTFFGSYQRRPPFTLNVCRVIMRLSSPQGTARDWRYRPA
jgi:hypothetical protein